MISLSTILTDIREMENKGYFLLFYPVDVTLVEILASS